MKLEKIILHVGLPKTGSTSIQEALFANRTLLAEHGYLYPSCWDDVNHSVVMRNLFTSQPFIYAYNLSNGLLTWDAIQKSNDKNLSALFSELEHTGCKRLILSAESISTLYLDQNDGFSKVKSSLIKLFGCDSFNVILYVRDGVSYSISLFQQNCITPAAIMPDINYKEILPGTFSKVIAGLWDTFGKDNVSIVQFEHAVKAKEGLIKNFVRIAGLPENIALAPPKKSHINASKALEVVEFANFCNSLEPLYSVRNSQLLVNPNRMLYDFAPLYQIPGTKFDLPFQKKEEFFNILYDDILWLKENVHIDYTRSLKSNHKIESKSQYQPETLSSFIEAFPKLSVTLKDLFLKYFSQVYSETGNQKFLPLFQRDSKPAVCAEFTKHFSQYLKNNPEEMSKLDILSNHTKSRLSGDFIKVFFAEEGQAFSEFNAKSYEFYDTIANVTISLTFDEMKKVKKVRVDPSLYPCATIIKNVKINGVSGEPCGGNFTSCFEDIYSFLNCDPQLLFENNEPITAFEIEISVEPASYALSFCIHKGYIDEKQNLERLIVEERQKAAQIERELYREREALYSEARKRALLSKKLAQIPQ